MPSIYCPWHSSFFSSFCVNASGVHRSALGTTAHNDTYVELHIEASTYWDIIQIDIAEEYQALTNKTMAGLQWATSRYPDARFILKSDDDSFNAIHRFSNYLHRARENNFIGGRWPCIQFKLIMLKIVDANIRLCFCRLSVVEIRF